VITDKDIGNARLWLNKKDREAFGEAALLGGFSFDGRKYETPKEIQTLLESLTIATESEQLRKVLNGASSLLKANADTIEQLRKERDDAVNNYGLAFELGRKNVLDELAKKVNENGNA